MLVSLDELDALKKYYQAEVRGKYFINIEDFSDTFLVRNWKLGALFFEYLKWKRNLRKIYFDDFVVVMESFHPKKSLKHKILHLYQVSRGNGRCSTSTSRTNSPSGISNAGFS